MIQRKKPGISNLLTIYSALTDISIKTLEEMYETKNYQVFKADLAEIVADALRPIQSKYFEIMNGTELDKILDQGAEKSSLGCTKKIS